MKVIGVVLLCGVFAASAAAPAPGDEVDDLLAGKPLAPEATSAGQPFESLSLEERIVSPANSAALVEGAGWEATIEQAPEPKPSPEPPQPAREPESPPSDVSLVPEPSAIALGVAAILYFLIFFRRRSL